MGFRLRAADRKSSIERQTNTLLLLFFLWDLKNYYSIVYPIILICYSRVCVHNWNGDLRCFWAHKNIASLSMVMLWQDSLMEFRLAQITDKLSLNYTVLYRHLKLNVGKLNIRPCKLKKGKRHKNLNVMSVISLFGSPSSPEKQELIMTHIYV